MDFRKHIIDLLTKEVKVDPSSIKVPPDPNLGDFAIPCFAFAKELKKAPPQVAEELAKKIKPDDIIVEIKSTGPYLNFFVNKAKLAESILTEVIKTKDEYGSSEEGKGKNIVIDFSSPNIAKPFGIGHLRSTVIGNSIYKIYTKLGYDCTRINHLGDWGTQFGKLIVAFRKWGSEEELEKDPINHLLSIYVKFHEEAEINPDLDQEARDWFKRLEDGDEDALSLWTLFKEISLNEFKKYYKELNIEFDSWAGEKFYNPMLVDAVEFVKKNTKTEMSDGALIVNLEDKKMAPLLLLKSDGASTYHTRDIAAIRYRTKTYSPEKIIYVVGAPQKLHFNQLFEVAEQTGFDRNKFTHVDFGLIRFPEGKMSTRKGNIIFLEEVLDKATELAEKIINEKNPDLKNKKKIAKTVGIGAVIFGDLSNDRVRDINFNWDSVINFEGETAPYIQYSHARICSMMRKHASAAKSDIKFSLLTDPAEQELIKIIGQFPSTIRNAAAHYKPHIIAKYLIDLCQSFNSFYTKCQVLVEDKRLKEARITLIDSTRQTIKNGLDLLGIDAPEEM